MESGRSLAGVARTQHPRPPSTTAATVTTMTTATVDAHLPSSVGNHPQDPLLIKLHYGDSLDIQQVAADGTVVRQKVIVVDDRAADNAAARKVCAHMHAHCACMLAG